MNEGKRFYDWTFEHGQMGKKYRLGVGDEVRVHDFHGACKTELRKQ